MARRSRYEGPTGIASVVLDAATRRGLSYLTLMGQAPHYLEGATNPAVSRALLTYVNRLLSLELDMSRLEKAVQAFGTRCDQAVAQDAATQAYVRQLEQDYDTTRDEAPRPQRGDDFNPEQLMQELEECLREERKGGAEWSHPCLPRAETGQVNTSRTGHEHRCCCVVGTVGDTSASTVARVNGRRPRLATMRCVAHRPAQGTSRRACVALWDLPTHEPLSRE